MTFTIADAQAQEIEHWGGLLFFSDQGTAGCPGCGWTGVPTVIDGVRSTFCPNCEVPDPSTLWEPTRRAGPKVGRNEPCPCGSGRKSKKCCG